MEKKFPDNLPYRGPAGHISPNAKPLLPIEGWYGKTMLTPEELQAAHDVGVKALQYPLFTAKKLKKRYKYGRFAIENPEYMDVVEGAIKNLGKLGDEPWIIQGLKSGTMSPQDIRKEIDRIKESTGMSGPQSHLHTKDVAMTIGQAGTAIAADTANKAIKFGSLLIDPSAKNMEKEQEKEQNRLAAITQAPVLRQLFGYTPESDAGAAIQKGGQWLIEKRDQLAKPVGEGIMKALDWADRTGIVNNPNKIALPTIGNPYPRVVPRTPEEKRYDIDVEGYRKNPELLGHLALDAADMALLAAPATKFVRGRILAPAAKTINRFGKIIPEKTIEAITPKKSILRQKIDPDRVVDPALEKFYDAAVTRGREADTIEDLLKGERMSRLEGGRTPETYFRGKWKPFEPRAPLGDAYQLSLLKARGLMDRGETLAKDLIVKFKNEIPDAARRELMADVLESGGIGMDNLAPAEKSWVERISKLNRQVGEELVSLGVLKPEQLAAHIPSFDGALPSNYFHRIYTTNLIDQNKFWSKILKGNFEPLREAQPINTGIAQRAEKLTKEQRTALGQLRDTATVQEDYMGTALKDIFATQLLHDINDSMPGIVYKDGTINLATGEPILKSELRRAWDVQKKLVKMSPENIDAGKRLSALEQAIEEHKPPKGFRKLDDSAGWGPLSGAYVHKALYNDLRSFIPSLREQTNIAERLWKETGEKAMSAFKVSKTALNIPSMSRNMPEGMMRLDLSGIPIERAAKQWLKALEKITLEPDSPIMKEMAATGLFKGSLVSEEMQPALKTLLKSFSQSGNVFEKLHGPVARFFRDAVDKGMNLYNLPDKITYLAKYMDELEQGSSKAKAALEAAKWGFDYSDVPQHVKFARRTVAPFATYQYKITPRLLEAMKKRPERFLKYKILPDLIANHIIETSSDFQPGEKESLIGMFADNYLRAGHPLFLPWRSQEGALKMIDLSHYFPWGNWDEAINEATGPTPAGEKGWEKYQRALMKVAAFGAPFPAIYASLFNNKEGPPVDMFTKQPLYNPHDSAWMTTLATSRYLLDSMLLPSFLTKQGALGKAMKIMAKDESADNTWGDVALNLLGATTKNVSAERQNFLIEEAKNTLRKAWGHYEATHDPEIDKDFMDKYREYQLGIYKLDHAGEEHAGRYGIGPWQAAMYQNNIQRMKDFGHIKTDDPYALALWEMIHTKHPSRSFWASTEPPQLTPQEAAKLLKQP